jgi:hypothetical protein
MRILVSRLFWLQNTIISFLLPNLMPLPLLLLLSYLQASIPSEVQYLATSIKYFFVSSFLLVKKKMRRGGGREGARERNEKRVRRHV